MYKTPTWIGKELWEMTPVQIRNVRERILEAWEMDLRDDQVIAHAKITRDQLDVILKKFPEFAAMKKEVSDTLNRKARTNVANSIDRGDITTSKWYLEKTDPQFSPKTRNETIVRVSVEEREEKIREMMEKYATADFTVIEEDEETETVDEGEHPGLPALQEDHERPEEDDGTGEAGRD